MYRTVSRILEGRAVVQRRCFKQNQKGVGKEVSAKAFGVVEGPGVNVRVLGVYPMKVTPKNAKYIWWGTGMLISGIISSTVMTFSTMVFHADMEVVTMDIRYLFEKRPFAKTAILHLIFMQNSCHSTANVGENSTSANTASIRHALETPEYAPLREVVIAMEKLASVHAQVSHSDLWNLAASVAIEDMGGPEVAKDYKFGRVDQTVHQAHNEPGLIPQPTRTGRIGCLRNMLEFGRMGLSTTEMVALMGAHTVGTKHVEGSGFSGQCTSNPLKFDNEYFKNLLEVKWTATKPDPEQGIHAQYRGTVVKGGKPVEVTMMPADVALLYDAKTRALVKDYAADEALWHKDFATAWLHFQDLNFLTSLRRVDDFSETAQRSFYTFGAELALKTIRDIHTYLTVPAEPPTTLPAATLADLKYAHTEIKRIVEDKEVPVTPVKRSGWFA